jgi:hypothetical protein
VNECCKDTLEGDINKDITKDCKIKKSRWYTAAKKKVHIKEIKDLQKSDKQNRLEKAVGLN